MAHPPNRAGRATVRRRTLLLGAAGWAAVGPMAPLAAGAPVVGPAHWARLRDRLRGPLVLPGDAAFGDAARLRDPRFDAAAPAGVVAAAGADDVRTAVTFAHDRQLPLAVRSGGHSYVGASATPGALVVDVRGLRDSAVDGDLMTVGAGTTTWQARADLARTGRYLPVGTCPTVGLAGLTLGGGLGVDSRLDGLTCDRLVAAELVLPDGATARVSADERADLFWTLRGGGGATGVVTSLTYRTGTATPKDILRLSFPGRAAARVLRGWAQWMPAAARTVWANIEVSATSTGLDCAALVVAAAGAGAAAAAELAAAAGVAPTALEHRTLAPLDAVRHLGGDPGAARTAQVAGSDILAQLSAADADDIVGAVADRAGSGASGYVLADPLDGAVADLSTEDTAFPWRSHAACLQWVVTAPDDIDGARDWLDTAHRAVTAASCGGYVNYVEPDATADRYYADNLPRLRAVRGAVDPDDRLCPAVRP